MIWNVLLIIVLAIWIMLYIKNKKTILSLPYLLMIFITPFYNMLDQKIFVKVFGCGCVPTTQTNMFNIDFNANNLRFLVYNILVIFALILGMLLSRKLKSKKTMIIYIASIILINLLLCWKICQLYMWG